MFWIGAIVSLCYVPGVTGAYIATQWPVLAVLLSFWPFVRGGPVTAYHLLGAVFLTYATVHAWFSPVPYFSVFGLWLVWIMGLALWFGTTLTASDKWRLYAGLAFGGAVSSLIAIFQYLGYQLLPTSSPAPAGLYVNSVQQGTVLALIAVALASERMWLLVLPLAPGIALSGSRGAWLALAIGLIGCYVRRIWLLGAVWIIGLFYLSTPLAVSDEIRVAIWGFAWHHLTWFGWGPGTFYATLLQIPNGDWVHPEYVHNDALQLVYEYGIGALPMLALFIFVLRRTEAREWPVVLAFTVAGCYSMPLWMPIASFLVFVAVGRVLRGHAVVLWIGDFGGRHVVSRGCQADGASWGGFPMEPRNLGEG